MNAKGVVVATSVDDLHGANNNLTKQTALSEKGEVINGRGDKPNRHDILTGSTGRHRLSGGQGYDLQELDKQHAGHRHGRPRRPQGPARRRCVEVVEHLASLARARWRLLAEADLRSTGGDGLLYCFAAN